MDDDKRSMNISIAIPVYNEEKAINAVLNELEDVLDVALGNGETTRLKWLGKSRTVKTKTLTEIKRVCGGCDFLKMDCDGCEWNIKPEELKGIRRIEMEVHKVGFPFSMMEERLSKAGFSYEVENQPEGVIGLWLIHARMKNGEQRNKDRLGGSMREPINIKRNQKQGGSLCQK